MLTPTLLLMSALTAQAFTIASNSKQSTTTALHMGLFDGVKEAFSAPALERSTINSERETPIDRWMGWSVVSEEEAAKAPAVGGYSKCCCEEKKYQSHPYSLISC